MNTLTDCPDYANCQQRCNETVNGIGWGVELQIAPNKPYQLVSKLYPSRCLAVADLPQYQAVFTDELRIYEQLHSTPK